MDPSLPPDIALRCANEQVQGKIPPGTTLHEGLCDDAWSCLWYGTKDSFGFFFGFTTASDALDCRDGSVSACILLGIGLTPLGVLGIVGKGAKKVVPEKWFKDLLDALPTSKPHTHNGVTPKITDPEQLKHAFDRHAHEWYGRRVPKETHMQEWTEMIQRGMRSKEVVPWSSGSAQTYAYINRFDGKNFVVQVDRQTGELVTAFMPSEDQLRAMYKLLGK